MNPATWRWQRIRTVVASLAGWAALATPALAGEPNPAPDPAADSVPAAATASAPPTIYPIDPLDTIGMAGLQEAFRVLRTSYIHRESLTPLELNRAALQGVLDRLDFGADLVTGEPPPLPFKPGFRSARLPGGVGYLRPVAFDAEEVAMIGSELGALAAAGVATLVLDLRAPVTGGDFAVAARLADFFVPADVQLFQVVRPGEDRPRVFVSQSEPVWSGPLVVLVDGSTSGVAEVVAAVLEDQLDPDPFTAGAPTPGRAVEYEEFDIAEAVRMRVAAAEVVLPDGTGLFRRGVTPDLAIPDDPQGKEAFFTAAGDDPAGRFVYESERPRLNEAALVSGTNPELPYLILRSADQPTPYDEPPVVDRVFQQVIDLIAASDFLRSSGD
jgi:hypothetical protein